MESEKQKITLIYPTALVLTCFNARIKKGVNYLQKNINIKTVTVSNWKREHEIRLSEKDLSKKYLELTNFVLTYSNKYILLNPFNMFLHIYYMYSCCFYPTSFDYLLWSTSVHIVNVGKKLACHCAPKHENHTFELTHKM